MEALLAWLLMFAAAAMIVLGILLLAAERELRKQRRELEKLRRNHRIRVGMGLRTSEAQGSETHPLSELMTRNKELIETISYLSVQLEESKRTVEELQCEQRQLVSAGELEQQLQASQETIKALEAEQQRLGGVNFENQQLRAEIENLRNQLQTSESLLNTTASQYGEVADRDLRLESDLAESRQQVDKLTMKNNELLEMINSLSSQLAASERTVEELRTVEDHLPSIQSENQQLHTENQALREGIASVKTQLGTTASCCNEAIIQAREITERNSKLQTEVSELTNQLQASQETIRELEAEQQRLGGVNLENQLLREEITTLRNQQTSETRLSESAWQNQEAAERYARLQNEVVEWKQQAEEGQARVRELEPTQEQLGLVESREMILREEQDKLNAQVADLQRELDTGREKVRELDATREQLAEMECVCQELREENRRLEEEISRWQERPAESEESQRHVSTLRQQLVELQAQQVAVSEANSLIDGLGKTGNPIDLSSDDSVARAHVANDEENKPFVQTPGKRTRHFGMIAATGAIAIVATVAVGALNTSSNGPSGSKEPAVAPETVSIEQSIPIEAGSKALKRSSPAAANEIPKQ